MMLLLLLLLLLLPLFEQMYEDSHLWVLSGNAKLQFPGELSCKPLTRSANDFCRYSFILRFVVVVIVIVIFAVVVLVVVVVIIVIEFSCQPHQEISKQLKCFWAPLKKSFKCWLLMIQSPLSRQHSITITGGNRAELFGVECNFQTFASSWKKSFRGRV